MKHKIVAGLTTKNEEWIVAKTINCLTKFCDSIIVYDDGSDDRTEEICRSYEKVKWYTRPPHDPLKREEALQRFELINILKKHDLDYALLLDADEIPTPSIVNFINNIDEDVHLWQARMINLWGSEKHYRVDSFKTEHGAQVNWDPFLSNSWKKYPFLKFDKNFDYTYNLKVQKGGCSRYHPSPENVPNPVKFQEDFYIIHYGKIAPSFLSGERLKFYARIEEMAGKGTYESRLKHHQVCSGLNPYGETKLKECKKEWFWD